MDPWATADRVRCIHFTHCAVHGNRTSQSSSGQIVEPAENTVVLYVVLYVMRCEM
jgi:hypothetical protein